MELQPIFDIAEICHQKGIKQAIISPGSRNAPLTIAFARHPEIRCYSIPDERSAAFMGLGMSLKTKAPTVLICTSGSAALNYAPAVAEAFFSQTPLLILTADRPPEWIGQLDGQTIYQENVYGKHVKKSFSFPDTPHEANTWHGHRIINEAINITNEYPKGPVHINLPFREPFYPTRDVSNSYSKNIKIINSQGVKYDYVNNFSDLKSFKKIVVIAGQQPRNKALTSLLSELSEQLQIPVICDVISNHQSVEDGINKQDIFLKAKTIHKDLKPDLIITYGLSVISKNLKNFLRTNKPEAHWHIQEQGSVAADTFQCLTKVINTSPLSYFKALVNAISSLNQNEQGFYQNWQNINTKCLALFNKSLAKQTVFNEFKAYQQVLKAIPDSSDLHLANSMAVRYANFLGVRATEIEVFCNRGTSGIDGSNSTAIGFALQSERLSVLLTGDMAFLYDRNAFWHNHLPKNIKIIVFNNHGGGIFRMIEGPRIQPEIDTYFETDQKSTAEPVAKEFGFEYFQAQNYEALDNGIANLFSNENTPAILEIFTDSKTNQKVYAEVLKST
jgi:2-succinyl-5-enolpyruvyl-6-hydroxy-3-cyclohexene-1-carboxylate synthase